MAEPNEAVELHLPPGLAVEGAVADLLAAVRAGDASLVEDNHVAALASMAPELLLNSPANMVATRDMLAVALQHNMISYTRYVRRIEHLSLRPTTGEYLLMGEETVYSKPTNSFHKGSVRRRFTDIWRKEGDAWVLSVRHATILEKGEPTG